MLVLFALRFSAYIFSIKNLLTSYLDDKRIQVNRFLYHARYTQFWLTVISISKKNGNAFALLRTVRLFFQVSSFQKILRSFPVSTEDEGKVLILY